MRKLFLLLTMALVFSANADAQGFLKKLKDKAVDAAKGAVEKSLENKAEDAVEEAADGANASEADAPKKKTAKGEEAKSDFVPGSVVIFEDNLSGEKMGEFPSKWDLIDNNAEVARMNGKLAIKFEHGADTKIMPLIKDGNKKYLPEVFTLEFDFFALRAKRSKNSPPAHSSIIKYMKTESSKMS